MQTDSLLTCLGKRRRQTQGKTKLIRGLKRIYVPSSDKKTAEREPQGNLFVNQEQITNINTFNFFGLNLFI